ncbi:RnfH family protein [Allopusillimonas ginsengisoli]|uniref:RnfH family protein n=1 Tax=Allopusillimonas ginsengisoli TaxID=453575 RepID=UPI001FD6D18E|nr:RnfH family protein [Allopusillimonas ginsengisoli]
MQVIFAQGPDEVWAVEMRMGPDATLGQAIDRSGFAQQFPDYDMADLKAGIFGQRCSRDHPLSEGDRVEIYRPLDFDPMESRRRRAQHRKSRLSRT